MTLNISSATKILSKVNSKGLAVLRKEKGLALELAKKEGLNFPDMAKSYDAVRVGSTTNPAQYTDIFTFRDKNGEIVKRFEKSVNGSDVTERTKWFEFFEPFEDLIDDATELIDKLVGKKVSSFTRKNGKISEIAQDFYSVLPEAKPTLTHFRRTVIPSPSDWSVAQNVEKILLEERRSGQAPKFICNEYVVDRFGNGTFSLKKSNASSAELEKIAQNSQFLPTVSPNTKFPHRMANACIDDVNMKIDPEVKIVRQTGRSYGSCSDDGVVTINLKSYKNMDRTRESLTKTIGHEVEHAKWNELCIEYDLYEMGLNDADEVSELLKNVSLKDVLKYKKSVENYISPKVDPVGYKKQFCEVVGNRGGDRALRKYLKLQDDLKKEFPTLHDFQFSRPRDNEDGLSSIVHVADTFDDTILDKLMKELF